MPIIRVLGAQWKSGNNLGELCEDNFQQRRWLAPRSSSGAWFLVASGGSRLYSCGPGSRRLPGPQE